MSEVPWPKTEEELVGYIRSLTSGEANHDGDSGYNYTADGLWKAAAATFYYMSHVFGCTGFQVGWAEMQFIRETRGLKGPFGIVDGEKILYPQYNLREQVDEWLAEWPKALAPLAKKRIAEAENDGRGVHPDVLARWKYIASLAEEGN